MASITSLEALRSGDGLFHYHKEDGHNTRKEITRTDGAYYFKMSSVCADTALSIGTVVLAVA